jgi:hypothetical protein
MVRNYVRTSSRCEYSPEDLAQSLSTIRRGELSRRKASQVYSIPRATLILRLKHPDLVPSSLGRFRPVFSADFENELVMHVVEMQERFYGLTFEDLQSLAYELAERNKLCHPFSKEKKRAGRDWAYNFLRRFPELSLRSPEPTSMSRLSGFNAVQVKRFHDLLERELTTKKYSADQVYNLDETGVTTVHKPQKILARKGSKQVGRFVSAERGTTTTVMCAMGAFGAFVPPMFIFKRKLMNDRLMKQCPSGSVGYPSSDGWIDSSLFVKYLKHFCFICKAESVTSCACGT